MALRIDGLLPELSCIDADISLSISSWKLDIEFLFRPNGVLRFGEIVWLGEGDLKKKEVVMFTL